jgi:hypothetical protein
MGFQRPSKDRAPAPRENTSLMRQAAADDLLRA